MNEYMRKREKGKKGQFYFIAALVMIMVLVGLVFYTYVNASTESDDLLVYYLTQEIHYEANQVIDSGVFTGQEPEEISENVQELAEYYIDTYPDLDMTMVYGDEEGAYIINLTEDEEVFREEVDYQYEWDELLDQCNKDRGQIAARRALGYTICSDTYIRERSTTKKFKVLPDENDKIVDVWLNDEEHYQFEITPGQQNFFILIRTADEGERTIIVK